MRVVVAAVSSNREMSGVSRHAANLAKCLLTRSEVSELHVLAASWEQQYLREAIARQDRRLHVHPISLERGALRRNLWYYRDLPKISEQLRADLVHLAYPSPIQADAFRCPTVVTLHDLYPYDIPSNFGFPKVMFNRVILRSCLQTAVAIACVSNTTKYRLGLHMPGVLHKATTICNAIESGPVPAKPSFACTWSNSPTLLCVAQHRRNKNLLLVLQVFASLLDSGRLPPGTRLLIVGMPGPESTRLYRFVHRANLTQRVIFIKGIPDAEMSWCYRNCSLLLAPSTLEGFGLPVLEAQLAGCPVVCSDIPAFREVGGAHCRFVPLDEAGASNFGEAIVSALHDPRPLPVHAPQFSPASIAEQYMRLYQLLLCVRVPERESSNTNQSSGKPKSSLADELPTAARS